MNDNDEQLIKRRDWQIAHREIGSALIRFYRDHQKAPTNVELARLVGISERSIVRHLKDMDYSQLFSEQRRMLAPLIDNVTMAIYNSAMKGSVAAQKLMLQIVFDWAEPKEFRLVEDATSNELSEEELANFDRGIDLLVNTRIRERERASKYAKVVDLPAASARE